jgi:hypothetical protein
MLVVQTRQASTYWSFKPEDQMFIITHNGLLTIEHLIENLRKIHDNPTLPKNLKVLQDSRHAQYLFDINNIHLIVAEFTHTLSAFDHVMWADVHANPKTTAMSFLFANSLPHTGDLYRLFSSDEEAINWLTHKQTAPFKRVKPQKVHHPQ